MTRMQLLILWALLLVCCAAERQYFLQHNASTWEQARQHCQVCYKEMVSLNPSNVKHLVQNLNSSYWIGLRKNLNGTIPWSRWSNGDPMTFQNWYPGRPILAKPMDPVFNVINTYSCPKCECCCPSGSRQSNDTNDMSTLDENMTVFTTMETMTTTTATVTMTPATTLLFTGVTGFTNETNGTEDSGPDDKIDLYIEDPCISMLSFGMWFEKNCSELLHYICYEDRFYGNSNVSNVTLDSGTLSWSAGPADINGYRVEVKGDINHTLKQSSLTLKLSNLTAGTMYRVQVFPLKCERDLNPHNLTFYTKPDVVKNLTVTAVRKTSVSLSWSPPNGNRDFYYVQVSGQPHLNMTTTTENCEIKGLIPGGLYTFEVNAEVKNKSIEGDLANTTAYTKPSVVLNLTVSNSTNDSLHLKWEWPVGNTSGFRVDVWEEKDGANSFAFRMNSTSTCLVVKPLNVGTKLWLYVMALVPDSSVVGDPVMVKGFTSPGAVNGLMLYSSQDAINATWKPPNGSYENFLLTLTGFNQEPRQKETDDNHCLFSELKAAANYTVTVYTKNGDLKSQAVSFSKFTLPVKPGAATITGFNMSHITLLWVAPEESQGVAVTYQVTYSAKFWNYEENLTLVNVTSHTFGGLHAGTKYEFKVQTVAGDQKSEPTVPVSKKTVAEEIVLTVAMECSSSEPLYCENNNAKEALLEQLRNHFRKKLEDDVHWQIDWRA